MLASVDLPIQAVVGRSAKRPGAVDLFQEWTVHKEQLDKPVRCPVSLAQEQCIAADW